MEGFPNNERDFVCWTVDFYTLLRTFEFRLQFEIAYLSIDLFRNVFSTKLQTKQACASSGKAFLVFIIAINAAGDGILPSMVLSARLQRRLMVWST